MQYKMHMTPASSKDEAFINRLKGAGERVTTPRLSIFRLLRQYSPLPMSKLATRSKADGIDLVTVYRSIALFKKLELVQEIGVGNKRLLELSDDFGVHHHHFWCSICGKIIDFDNESFERSLENAATKLGIRIQSHQVEVVGICRECLQKEHIVDAI
jgi:Fe2+ or Zn2+ uptake regulation protein